MKSTRNIYCVGRNYGLHAAELGNDVPQEPMIFCKPTHALAGMNGEMLQLPSGRRQIHYEAELVVRIGRPFHDGMHADEAIEQMALGIDFTLRDVQSVLKSKGHPWLAAKGFKNAAAITDFIPYPGWDKLKEAVFSLSINGKQVQSGQAKEMIFDLQRIVTFCAENYGLDEGDLIYTGTPAGVGALQDNDRLELFYEGKPQGSCIVKF